VVAAVRAVEPFDSGLEPGVEMVVALAKLTRRKYHHEC
jgi:hypothetical protein